MAAREMADPNNPSSNFNDIIQLQATSPSHHRRPAPMRLPNDGARCAIFDEQPADCAGGLLAGNLFIGFASPHHSEAE
jgi:hypothetical protein